MPLKMMTLVNISAILSEILPEEIMNHLLWKVMGQIGFLTKISQNVSFCFN